MRRILSLVLVLVMSITIISGCAPKVENGGGNGEKVEKHVIKISHPSMPGSPRDLGANKIKEVVEKETNGQVEVQVYPSQQLGFPQEIMTGMQNGDIEMGIYPFGMMAPVQPLVAVLDIPFMYPNTNDDMIEFLKSDASKEFMDITDSEGITTLDLWFGGLRNFTSNKPIKTLADFKGQKFRVMPAPILVKQFEAMGTVGVDIDFSEVYSAFQTGAIDGQENPYDVIYEQKYHEVQKYITESKHASIVLGVSVSKVWWDALPADIQEAVRNGIEAGNKECLEKTLENEVTYKKTIEDAGVTIIQLTDEEIEEFSPIREQVIDLYLDKYGDEGKRIFDILKEEADKYK